MKRRIRRKKAFAPEPRRNAAARPASCTRAVARILHLAGPQNDVDRRAFFKTL